MDALYILFFFIVINFLTYYFTTEQKLRRKSKAYVLAEEALSLRKEAKQLQSPATFSKCALLERKANKLDKEIAELQQEPKLMDPNFLSGLRTIKFAVCGALLYQWWGKPIAYVPLPAVTMMTSRTAFPHGWQHIDNECGVSIMAWLILCESASAALLRAVDSVIRR